MNAETQINPKRPFKARPTDITIVERDESAYNERLMTVMPAMVDAIRGVVKQYDVKRSEYQLFREFLVAIAAGPFGTISGVTDAWIERVFDHTEDPNWRGTRANPEGPFYVRGVPLLNAPEPGKPYVLYRRENEPGARLLVDGKVLSLDGEPIPHAELDIWHAADTGFYSMLGMDPDQPEWNLRGRIIADEKGNYEFLTVRPPPYCTPGVPELLYQMFALMGKSYFRPAHIHVRITHPDIDPDFFTQLYFKGDPYCDFDIGIADNTKLQFEVDTIDDPAELTRLGLSEPVQKIHCDFLIETKNDK